MKKQNFLGKIYYGSKLGRYFISLLIIIPFAPVVISGYILFYILKPLVALSYLLMLDFRTFKTEIKDWKVWSRWS